MFGPVSIHDFNVNLVNDTCFLSHSISYLVSCTRFLVNEHVCLSICPTAQWSEYAITVAGSPNGHKGFIASRLADPNDVHVDNNSILYVLDSGNARVQRFLPNLLNGITVIAGIDGIELSQFSSSKF